MTTTKTPRGDTGDVYRRRALHQLAVTLTAGHGWTRERADAYAALLANHDPVDVEHACRDLATTWTGRVMPPPAEIIARANARRGQRAQVAATTRETTHDRDRGLPATVRTIRGPRCPACDGVLVHLTDEKLVHCPACNGVVVQDVATGRTRLTYDESTRLAHGHVPRTMPPTHHDATPTTPPERRGA